MGPRPVIQVGTSAKILIVGQAPGSRVHETGIPFNDPSGDRLRSWMGIEKEAFYDESKVAIVPMGFCFPGTGKSGDLPPSPECAKTWRVKLLDQLPEDNRVQWPFGRRWLDAKTVHVTKMVSQGKILSGGLSSSMKYYNLKFQGRKHDALDDAENTWRIYYDMIYHMRHGSY